MSKNIFLTLEITGMTVDMDLQKYKMTCQLSTSRKTKIKLILHTQN